MQVFKDMRLHFHSPSFSTVTLTQIRTDADNIGIGIPTVVSQTAQARIGGILGIPRHGLDGIVVGVGIHFPIGNAQFFQVGHGGRLVGLLTVFGLLVLAIVAFGHEPGCGRWGRIDGELGMEQRHYQANETFIRNDKHTHLRAIPHREIGEYSSFAFSFLEQGRFWLLLHS